MTVHGGGGGGGGGGTGTTSTRPPSYEFSSKPRPVKVRAKLRQEDLRGGGSQGMRPEAIRHGAGRPEGEPPEGGGQEFLPVNIHHDPRVARGNTFAGDRRGGTPPATTGPKAASKPKRGLTGKNRSRGSSSSFIDKTAVQSFLQEELDLSRYLVEPEEATAWAEQEVDTQTDAFKDRPESREYVPQKTGVDVSTQIEDSDSLFDIHKEIEPLLDVLVGKTLEQARIEVEREHELETIQQAADALKHERAAEAKRDLELLKAAVLAEREKAELRQRRREEAKERRVAKEKVACLQLVRQIFPLALEGAFEELSGKSWTTQSVQQIKNNFLPWLFERVASDVDRRSSVRATLEGLLVSVDEAAELATVRRTETRQREAAESRQEAIRIAHERPIKFFVPAELVGGEEEQEGAKLGPVTIKAGETVKAAEGKVVEWLGHEGGVEEVTSPEGGFFGGYLREARRRGGGGALVAGDSSLLVELQERVGVCSEVVLQVAFEA